MEGHWSGLPWGLASFWRFHRGASVSAKPWKAAELPGSKTGKGFLCRETGLCKGTEAWRALTPKSTQLWHVAEQIKAKLPHQHVLAPG